MKITSCDVTIPLCEIYIHISKNVPYIFTADFVPSDFPIYAVRDQTL